jgi:hypothetical protein
MLYVYKYIMTYGLISSQGLGKHSRIPAVTKQQSYNFRCHAARCKYNRRRCVLCVLRKYPLLGNGYVLYGAASRLYK